MNHKNRKGQRWDKHDYSGPGNYFVTICTKNRTPWFGEVVDGEMILSDIGRQAWACWYQIPEFFPNVYLDQFIVMPDHVHGIICINDAVGAEYLPPDKKRADGNRPLRATNLSSVVRGFKIGLTKWCHQNHHPNFAWQRSFHDRIIRNQKELDGIRKYIACNPHHH